MKISRSTLCRKLKRNGGRRGCHCEQAQVKADGGKRRSQDYRDLTTGLRKFVRNKITEEQRSPARIAGYPRKKGEKCVCVETVHAYVRADKAAGENPWKHCRHRLRHRKRQVKVPYTVVQNRTMMDERPSQWDGSTPWELREGYDCRQGRQRRDINPCRAEHFIHDGKEALEG